MAYVQTYMYGEGLFSLGFTTPSIGPIGARGFRLTVLMLRTSTLLLPHLLLKYEYYSSDHFRLCSLPRGMKYCHNSRYTAMVPALVAAHPHLAAPQCGAQGSFITVDYPTSRQRDGADNRESHAFYHSPHLVRPATTTRIDSSIYQISSRSGI